MLYRRRLFYLAMEVVVDTMLVSWWYGRINVVVEADAMTSIHMAKCVPCVSMIFVLQRLANHPNYVNVRDVDDKVQKRAYSFHVVVSKHIVNKRIHNNKYEVPPFDVFRAAARRRRSIFERPRPPKPLMWAKAIY